MNTEEEEEEEEFVFFSPTPHCVVVSGLRMRAGAALGRQGFSNLASGGLDILGKQLKVSLTLIHVSVNRNVYKEWVVVNLSLCG